jgi:fermentation-respiration switch protein FrsA (DUF1100 family)
MTSATTKSQNPAALAAEAWDKTFPKSDKVPHGKVSSTNRIGITLVGDYYTPKDTGPYEPIPAIVVGHPYGGVKEQTAGLYAQNLAERGFATPAFDVSFNGESGGEPRPISSPEIVSEDFIAAVDFLGTRPEVDKHRIGGLGICGSGGFALSAAQFDPRMKVVATVSRYDMSRAVREGLNDTVTEEQRRDVLTQVAERRWAEYGKPDALLVPGSAVELTDETNAVGRESYDYYRTPRGQHPRSTTAFTVASLAPMMRFRPFDHLDAISPHRLLLVAGETAHSRYFSEDAYKQASEPKELFIVPGAGHVDLYDRVDLVPREKLVSFFKANLKQPDSSATSVCARL